MAKGQRRDPKREAFWRDVLARQAGSSLSVLAFCRREGVPDSAFYTWRRKIKVWDQESSNRTGTYTRLPRRPDFLPVVLHPSDAQSQPPDRAGESIAIELRGGRVMRLPASLRVNQIAAIVQALEGQTSGFENRYAGGLGKNPVMIQGRPSPSQEAA